MKQKREESWRVEVHECGGGERIEVYSLMRRFQAAAAAQAEEMGFGPERLRERECYWVLSAIVLETERLALCNEEVVLRTWPSGHNRVTAMREFTGHAAGGEALFRAGSEWMVLGRGSGRPRNLEKLDRQLPGEAEKAVIRPLPRLERPERAEYGVSILVPYSAIDLNGHVNNAEYVRWGMDLLRQEYEWRGQVKRVQVCYLSEVFEGERVDVGISRVEEERYMILGKKAEGGVPVFLMEVRC